MVLKKYPTAIHMREAKVFNLVKICRRVQGNSYSKDFAFKLIKTVKEFIYSGKAYRVRGENLRILLEEIESLKEENREDR